MSILKSDYDTNSITILQKKCPRHNFPKFTKDALVYFRVYLHFTIDGLFQVILNLTCKMSRSYLDIIPPYFLTQVLDLCGQPWPHKENCKQIGQEIRFRKIQVHFLRGRFIYICAIFAKWWRKFIFTHAGLEFVFDSYVFVFKIRKCG